MSGKIGYLPKLRQQQLPLVLIPFMSGKIGYVSLEDTPIVVQFVLIPFMSGKIGYSKGALSMIDSFSLNPFYVREDWLRLPQHELSRLPKS